MRSIRVSELKAKGLANLDEVNQTAELAPEEYPQETLRGTVKIHGDVLEPVLPTETWESEGQAD